MEILSKKLSKYTSKNISKKCILKHLNKHLSNTFNSYEIFNLLNSEFCLWCVLMFWCFLVGINSRTCYTCYLTPVLHFKIKQFYKFKNFRNKYILLGNWIKFIIEKFILYI